MSNENELFNGISGLGEHLGTDETIELEDDFSTEKEPETERIDDPSSSEDKNDKTKNSDSSKEENFLIDFPDESENKENTKDDKGSGEQEESIDKKKESQNTQESSPSSDDPQVTAYVNFMENLHNTGTLSSFDKEEFIKQVEEGKDPNELVIEAKQKEIDKRVEEKFNGLTEEEKAIYEGKKSGVPLDHLGQLDKAVDFYENLDRDYLEENEEVAKQIITSNLKNKGFSDEDIQEQLDVYEEKDTLADKAEKFGNENKKIVSDQRQKLLDDAKQKEEDRKKEIEKYKEQLKSTISSVDEIIPGIKINKGMQDQLYDDFTKPVRYDENDQPVDIITDIRGNDPEMFDIALRYYARVGLFNFDKDKKFNPDFSKINNNLQTKEAKRIKKIVDNTDAFVSKNSNRKSGKENTDLFGGI